MYIDNNMYIYIYIYTYIYNNIYIFYKNEGGGILSGELFSESFVSLISE